MPPPKIDKLPSDGPKHISSPPGPSVSAGSNDPGVPGVVGISIKEIAGSLIELGSGNGVAGRSGSSIGVEGTSESGTGVKGSSGSGIGVQGLSSSPDQAGVSAINDSGGYGLWAASDNNTGDVGGVGIYARGAKYAAWLEGAVYNRGDHHCTGTVTVDGDIVLSAADCAEEFDITTSPEIEPGTVMVLTDNGALEPSRDAYDKKVAGIISGAGDYRPGMILDRRGSSQNRMPIALVGKVYCKVDAEYEPIQVGDLLTTSPTPGHAMKASNPLMAFGAVIGKALRPLRFGRGLVPVLVALQ